MNIHSTELLTEAIGFYEFTNPIAVFIRHNENITYSIEDGKKKYLLRIHVEAEGLNFSFYRGNLSREVLVASEIDLLNGLLKSACLILQRPIANKTGQYLTRLDNGAIVTVLSWLNGETLVDLEFTEAFSYKIGQMTARLHKSLSELPRLNRCVYDDIFVDTFLSELYAAKDSKHIDPCVCGKLEILITEVKKILGKERGNHIIIHLDLSEKNMIYDGNSISPIDFSMSGYGIPEMDLGDLYNMIGDNQLMLALLSGYESVATYKLNRDYLNIFKAFSLIQYILIHHTKLHMDEKFNNRIKRWTLSIFDPVLLKIKQGS